VKIAELRKLLAGSLDLEQFQVEGILDKLTPVLILENLEPDAGATALQSQWAMGQTRKAAVAGQFGRFQLSNPAGSGIDLHVLRVIVSTAAAAYWLIADIASAGLATAGAQRLLHKGATVTGAPVALVTNDSNAASGISTSLTIVDHDTVAGVTPIEFEKQLIIPAGHAIRVVSATQNLAASVVFHWKEVQVT
jgi:hypothetical protein